MRKHPSWYYQHYGEVFGRGGGYAQDVEAILQVTPLFQKSVQEVGAGTGEHAARLLEHCPSSLELVDDDEHAVESLRSRFADKSQVRVLLEDGFEGSNTRQHDVIIAMYSIILQGVASLRCLQARIETMYSNLRPGGVALFEWIDSDVSRQVYKHGVRTTLHKRGKDIVEIFSEYGDDSLVVNYEGRLHGDVIEYRVPMLAVNRISIEKLMEGLVVSSDFRFGTIPLDLVSRRMLGYVSRLP